MIQVDGVAFTPAQPEDVRSGVLGWATIVVNDALMLLGIAVRRTRDDRLTLSFPERTDRHGLRHTVVRPLNSQARQDIERQVFEKLGVLEESTS